MSASRNDKMMEVGVKTERRCAPRRIAQPPEIAFLYLIDGGYVPETNLINRTDAAFVEVLDRNETGAALKSIRLFETNSELHLLTFNAVTENWDVASGTVVQTRAMESGRSYFRIGVELSQEETHASASEYYSPASEQMPTLFDYPFLIQTKLIKSLPREAVCPLLNSLTLTTVKAGKRFMVQGASGN